MDTQILLMILLCSVTTVLGRKLIISDYCGHIKGRCVAQCAPSHISLEVRHYLCYGQMHCCLPDRGEYAASASEGSGLTDGHMVKTGQQPKMKRQQTKSSLFKSYSKHRQSGGSKTYREDTMTPLTCVSHKRSLDRPKRVVGGVKVTEGDLPWMTFISRDLEGSDRCGGALISDRHVITAAHCFDRLDGFVPQLTVGENVRYDGPIGGENVRHDGPIGGENVRHDGPIGGKYVTSSYKVTKHPRYRRTDFNYDVAILTLAQPINMTQFPSARPICLPEPDLTFPAGTICAVAGWGSTVRGSPPVTSPSLLQTWLPLVDASVCSDQYGGRYHGDTQLCAGDASGASDSCEGDSGGPLMCPGPDSQDSLYLAGIVSVGSNPCGQPRVPAVYTRITGVMGWVEGVVVEG